MSAAGFILLCIILSFATYYFAPALTSLGNAHIYAVVWGVLGAILFAIGRGTATKKNDAAQPLSYTAPTSSSTVYRNDITNHSLSLGLTYLLEEWDKYPSYHGSPQMVDNLLEELSYLPDDPTTLEIQQAVDNAVRHATRS